MIRETRETWLRLNQSALASELDRLRRRLERHVRREEGDHPPETAPRSPSEEAPPPALEALSQEFGLSPFEREILLLALGVELDSRIQALADAAGGACFGLAMAAFAEPHWSAAFATGPLRHWGLVELGAGTSLARSPLRIDDAILAFLLGEPALDRRLAELAGPDWPETLSPSQLRLAERLARTWREAAEAPPVLRLHTAAEGAPTRAIAAQACAMLGLDLLPLAAAALPSGAAELGLIARLAVRHARLARGAVLLEFGAEEMDRGREGALARFAERLDCLLFTSGVHRPAGLARSSVVFEALKPEASEQAEHWRAALGGGGEARAMARKLGARFRLSASGVDAALADARATAGAGAKSRALALSAWDAARRQSRPRLDGLAQRLEGGARWGDLVLPPPQLEILRGIAAQLDHRDKVHEDWGFDGGGATRGLGLAVLFTGSSGTGKTTAAEAIAAQARLDLYRVDLSAVVSKYIGETEKNLRRVFDAADESGAILLFDEADALFGKRTEVSDSHDRHANIEVSYLLQRIETFRGLAILTSNMKNAMDGAFLRRLRFIVAFPFPDAGLRATLWRRAIPDAARAEGLDFGLLSQLVLSGGQIKTIALNAAFLAAAAGRTLGMKDIRLAAEMEYSKHDKTPNGAELRGWAA